MNEPPDQRRGDEPTAPEKAPEIPKLPAVEALVKILIQEGVEVLFGIPGSHVCPLFDAVAQSGKIRIILPRHEQGAAYMADGYARVARRMAVCAATVGPGATNLLTGVAAAYADGIPMIVLTGQAPAAAQGKTAHQEATGLGRTPDQLALFAAVTKSSFAAIRASKIPQLMRTAFRIALNGRFGPVNVTIPSDVFYDPVPFQDTKRGHYRVTRSNNVDPALVQRAVNVIARAECPVILAGQRSLFPDATREIRDLAERFHIPVVTPLNAKGSIDEDHELALGCLGLVGQPAAEKYVREVADVVIAVGENFEELTNLSWDPEIIEGKQLIHIDVDPLEIGKNVDVTVGVDGTIRRVIDEMKNQLVEREYQPRATLAEIQEYKRATHYFDSPECESDEVPLKPQRVMRDLRQALPPETIVFGDSGLTVRWVGRFFPARTQSFFAANLFEPMGYSVAACLGGKLAAPDRPVVSICGDGSFLMNGMEVSTAVNHGIPVIWIIMNDGRLNMVYQTQSIYYADRHVATEFNNPDYMKFAEAFGARGFRVDTPGEIIPAVQQALASGQPAIVDVHIDPDEVPPMHPRALVVGRQMRLPKPTVTKTSMKALTAMMRQK